MDGEPDNDAPEKGGAVVVRHAPAWAIWNSESMENLTRIGQRVVFVLAATFAVYEYAQGRQDVAEQKAFDLVAVWETDEYEEAFATARSALSTAMTSIENIDQSAMSDDELLDLRSRVGMLSLEGESGAEVQDAVDSLVYFAGRVGFCSSRGLCDRKTLTEFFGDTLNSLRAYYAGYIERRRQVGSTTFGEYLDRFLEDAGYGP